MKMNRFSEYDDPMDLLKYEFSDYLWLSVLIYND